MEFVYKNLGSKSDVKFTVDDEKKIIAVYGKNGTGKTTFSINPVWDKKYVFNEIFVRENIYVSTDEGISTSPDNKKNLSGLFIGSDIISIQKDIESLALNKKEYKQKIEHHLTVIKNNFLSVVSSPVIEKLATELCKYISLIAPTIAYDDLEKNITDFDIIEDTLNEDDFHKNLILFNNQQKLQTFIDLVQQDLILSEIIFKKDLTSYQSLYKNLTTMEQHLAHKKKLDAFVSERKVGGPVDDAIISKILEIQGDNDICFVCGTPNKNTDIKKWIDYVNSTYTKEKNLIIKSFKTVLDKIGHINSGKQTVIAEIPNTFDFLNKLEVEIKSTIEKLKNDNFKIESQIKMVEFEQVSLNIKHLQDALIIHLIAKDKKKIVGSFYQMKNIDAKVESLKKDLNEKLDAQVTSITTEVNEVLKEMQVNRKIALLIDKLGGSYKYKYSIDGKDIDTLSDGQRHKLALAFFLASVNKLGLKDKTIILDDPVVALDELGYHVLKKYIIQLRTLEPSLRVIILTHNIYYLYVQLSNIFENEELRNLSAFYRMTSTNISQFDIDILRIDDISLFKRCFCNIKDAEDVIILSGIVYKIFRQFVDIKHRFTGKLYSNFVHKDIKDLDLDKESIKRLLELNDQINHIGKDSKTINFSNSLLLIELLCESMNLLGFGEYIELSEVTKLKKLNSEKCIVDELKSSDIYFEMIDAANDILHRGILPEIRNYLAHPRQQITKQITSLSNDLE